MREVQLDIDSGMRRILVDWLVDVHARFSLKSETLHKAVFFMDRFLSRVDIHRNALQLVGSRASPGITALFIAAKLEEVAPPGIQSFVFVCDNAYTKPHIVDMEARMLLAADFRLVVATGLQLLAVFAEQLGLHAQEFWLARYFLDYSLLKYSLCGKRSRFLAAGALLLALYYFQHPAEAVDNFIKVNCLDFSEVRLCSFLVFEAALEGKASPDFSAVERKYADAAVFRVSELPVRALRSFFPASN
jgi:cyclin B